MRVYGEIAPPRPSPFRAGAHYQVTRAFVALRDEFREGEELIFVRDAYSLYDGITGYFFRDAQGRSRVFDVYDDRYQGDAVPEWDVFTLLPTPRSVRVTAILLAVYVSLAYALALGSALASQDLPPLWAGVARACLGFGLAGGLLRQAGWAWWGAVGLGVWVGLDDAAGLWAGLGRPAGHTPAPVAAAHLLGAVFAGTVVARLLSRAGRAAFGLTRS